ncbi:hypothetical protein ACMD2_01509, partial [Ananas comosus]
MAALLIYYSLLPFFALASSLDLPSHGCYWTECQSKWFGGCSSHFSADLSDNCNGLCGESDSPPCLPFHTHFHCCIPETPKVTNRCGRCNNKLDFGEEYICCTDCAEPYIMDKAKTFKWVSGPWMKCSAPCDGGVRYRDVACFGSTAGTSVKQYPVDDARCSLKDM